MPELICPHCQNVQRVRKADNNTPYQCKQCYTPFYLNASGVAVEGAPPRVDEELEALKQGARETLGRLPRERIRNGLLALIVIGLVGYLLLRPAQRLEGPAGEAAQAMADGDLGALKSFAASGTAKDLDRWYETARARLARSRETWHGRDEVAEARIGPVDESEGTGVALLSVHPAALGSTRDTALADPAAATAAAPVPFGVETVWVRNRWGHWKLDGHATLSKLQGTTPNP